MMDWKILLLISSIVIYIGVIWFFTIKDMVKYHHYLKSQKITNRTYYEKSNNKPKPSSMLLIKLPNLIKGYKEERYEQKNCDGDSDNFPKVVLSMSHIKSIIKRLSTKCK